MGPLLAEPRWATSEGASRGQAQEQYLGRRWFNISGVRQLIRGDAAGGMCRARHQAMFPIVMTSSRSRGAWFRRPLAAWFIGGIAGAGLTYLLDWNQGRRRRSLVVDKLAHYRHGFTRLLGKAQRDFYNRAIGLQTEAKRRLSPARPDDATLVARARTKLGRYVSSPHAVAVHAERGKVTLAGPVLEADAKRLIKAIERIPGVTAVEDQLERHGAAENVPALQGGTWRRGDPPEILQRSWTPSLRVGAGVAALGLLALGVRRRSGAALAVPVGAALLLRAVYDRPIAALLGWGAYRDGFDIKKSIAIHAPPEQVFALLTAFESYPRFMRHMTRVERIDDSRYRWTVRGKTGVELQFESEIRELVPEERIVLGHVGDHRGEHFARVRLEAADGATRLHIEARYLPRLGAIGVGLTRLLGAHPKALLDADLVTLKSLLEDGRARIAGRQITLDEVRQLGASAAPASMN